MNKRKLVSIRTVSAIYPIKGADFIELVQVDGWQCIAKKGEFKVNSLCVYFEIDSFLPLEERYSFMPKESVMQGTIRGYRVRSMKMRGALSQGLALPIRLFPEIDGKVVTYKDEDISELLNVIKYDNSSYQPQPGDIIRKTFPSFIPKTDQERIQNLTSYFTRFKDHEFEETYKMDGSSMTVYKKVVPLSPIKARINEIFEVFGWEVFGTPTHSGVCSRNQELAPDNSNFWRVAKMKELTDIPAGYAIQGELCGPKIQNNHEKLSEYDFFLFDVYDIANENYLLPYERRAFAAKYLPNVAHKELIISKSVRIFTEESTLPELLKRVEGPSLMKGTVSEGRVYKSTTVPGLSFKAISNKYLLSGADE